jgi:cell division protein FtsI (penicillin-binding protein 3)
MSAHDPHLGARPAPSWGVRRFTPSWRWLTEGMWWVEHAFGRARADARPEEDTRVRIFVILSVFSVVFISLTLGAVHAAVLRASGAGGAASHPNAVVRADLVDRHGALLATNIVHYGLYIDPAQVWDRRAAAARIKRALPRVSTARLERALTSDRRLLVINRLTPQEKAAVHALALGGVGFEPEDVRVYPLGESARHVVGNVDTGGIGLSAAERAFNDEIRAAGARGESFQISIDLRVQGVLENELAAAAGANEAKGAVGVITDVQTGEVLAMASWPGGNSRNLASAATYEMGSVFKTFTVAAAIDTGRADMNTMLDASEALQIGRRRITDFHAQNKVMTLEEVYLHSSNIGTSRLSTEMGPRVMRDYFDRFGLLATAPFEIPSESPIVPRDWSDSTLASLSFGYGVSITPLQMAAAMGALTNGGRYIPLTLRKGGRPDVAGRQIVSPETSLIMLDLMRRNVVRGSGSRAEAPGLRVGGKTGSANKSVNGRYSTAHAIGTFAGVFPADGPVNARRYQILILIDEPQTYPRTGGFVAAPAVGRIVDRIAPFLGVERRADAWRTAVGDRIPAFEDLEGDGR